MGGCFEFVYVVGFLLVKGLLTYIYVALVANRMYLAPPVDSKTSCGKKIAKPQPITSLDETHLDNPFFLEFWTLLSKCVCHCCLKNTAWHKYERQLKLVKFDYERNLDVTMILRRMKMNGFAIHYLLSNKVRVGLAGLTKTKPIRYISKEKTGTLWD